MPAHDTAIVSAAAGDSSFYRGCIPRRNCCKCGKAKNPDEERRGSDAPTKAAFPFLHADALSEAGHNVQIFLLGEAVSLMRKSVANAVVPVGWPPLSEVLTKIVAKKMPIYACGACSRTRGITETDLTSYGAKFGNPKIFVSLIEWADKVITE